jgi:transcriptional antiterminator
MKIFEHIYLLERVHFHIEHKSTGTPKEFATRLNISERTLYRTIEVLKDLGADIVYSAERSSYVYKNDVKINIHLQIGQIDKSQSKGGNNSINFDPLPYLAVITSIIVPDSY